MSTQAIPKSRWSVKRAITWVLILQVSIALFLVGRDALAALPRLVLPSRQPQFDIPISPGDQTRRYRPGDLPLETRPGQPFPSTRDMPSRLLFERDGTALTLTGQIADGDAARFDEFLLTSETVETARLNSPGGSVQDALAIGRVLRRLGASTVMEAGDICLSACPYILAGGAERLVHDDAQVGVHQHYFGANTALPAFLAVETIQRGQGEVMVYLDEMGVDPRLMQHALITPPDEIFVLLPDQLEQYSLSTASNLP